MVQVEIPRTFQRMIPPRLNRSNTSEKQRLYFIARRDLPVRVNRKRNSERDGGASGLSGRLRPPHVAERSGLAGAGHPFGEEAATKAATCANTDISTTFVIFFVELLL